MKKKTFLWVVCIGLVVVGYFAGTRAVKGFVEKKLSAAMAQPVTIRDLALTFPPAVVASGIQMSPDFYIQHVAVRVSLLSLLMGKGGGIDLEATAPKVSLERGADGKIGLPVSAGKPQQEPSPPSEKKKGGLPFTRLRIREGEITFVDKKVRPEVTWKVRHLGLSVKAEGMNGGFSFGSLGEFQDANAKPIGRFEAKGKFFQANTGEADVTIHHEALGQMGAYVVPAFGSAPSSGQLDLHSKMTFHEGTLVAGNTLAIRRLAFSSDQPTFLGPVGSRLVELLQDPQGEIHLTFVVTGRLGQNLNWSDLVNSTLREAMRQALSRSLQKTLTDVEELGSVEDLIKKGLESLGK